jgi:plasmid stabilization system protein ParE
MKIVWTRGALADLADIATYYASNANPVIAEAVGQRFVDVVERVRVAFLGATRCAPFRGSCRSGRPLPIPDVLPCPWRRHPYRPHPPHVTAAGRGAE